MKVTEHIKKADGNTLFSFEVIPPQKGKNIKELYANIEPLMEFEPPFIDVTTSREEYVYIDRGNGLLDRKVTRMRPGTLGICSAIMHKYHVDTIPHLLCGGFTKAETEYMLVDCQYLGIENIMALRGDAMKHQRYFEPTKGGHCYANELVAHIQDVNNGQFLDSLEDVEEKSDFCVGVAAYPEKHFESPSMATDLKRLKDKVDAGADYVVTQMFFNNQAYFDFVDAAREIGITVPIIPGIKPVAIKRHLQLIPQVFSLDLPDELVSGIEDCKDNAEVRQVGIDWAIQQSKALKAAGVPVLHYYSMGKADNIKAIVKAVF